MGTKFPWGSATVRGPYPSHISCDLGWAAVLRTPDPEAFARMCKVLSNQGRLMLFKRIAAFGSDGVDAAEIGRLRDVRVLIEVGLVEVESVGQTTWCRARRGAFVRCLTQMMGYDPGVH